MKWKVVAKDSGSPLIHPSTYMLGATCKEFEKIIGKKTSPAILEFKEREFTYCFVENALKVDSEILLKKFENKKFCNAVNRQSLRTINNQQKIIKRNIKGILKKTNKELITSYNNIFQAWIETSLYGHIVNWSDFDHFLLTTKINDFITTKAKDNGINPQNAFATLTAYTEKNPLRKQEEDFLKLLMKVEMKGFHQKTEKLIEKHAKKYYWINFKYDGPAICDVRYFTSLLKIEIKQKVNAKEILENKNKEERKLKYEQNDILKKLNLTEKEKHLVNLARRIMFLKAFRKDNVFIASYLTNPLIKEIGKRLKLTTRQIRHLTPSEIELALNGKEIDKSRIDERIKHSIWIYHHNNITILSGKKTKEYSKNIYEEKPENDLKEIRGTVACTGYAKGKVRIINNMEEMQKMQKGDILVSYATNPNLMPAIKKAAAIVTDAGGITCHAAIVAREMNIPCIIGTRVATKALKGGDLVEVDANKGIVKIVKGK